MNPSSVFLASWSGRLLSAMLERWCSNCGRSVWILAGGYAGTFHIRICNTFCHQVSASLGLRHLIALTAACTAMSVGAYVDKHLTFDELMVGADLVHDVNAV